MKKKVRILLFAMLCTMIMGSTLSVYADAEPQCCPASIGRKEVCSSIPTCSDSVLMPFTDNYYSCLFTWECREVCASCGAIWRTWTQSKRGQHYH